MEPNRARANLELAVAALARDLPGMASRDACARLGWLRQEAAREGFAPAAMLADGLASAIIRDGRNVPLAIWLDALSLAAGCGADNAEAGPLLMATVGVRFAA